MYMALINILCMQCDQTGIEIKRGQLHREAHGRHFHVWIAPAKKVNKEFQTPPTSSHHTTRSAKEDIERMTKYLLEEKVAETCTARSTPTFEFLEPIELGMEMVVKGWIKKYLQSTFSEIDHEEQNC